jgi:hypothetical protein
VPAPPPRPPSAGAGHARQEDEEVQRIAIRPWQRLNEVTETVCVTVGVSGHQVGSRRDVNDFRHLADFKLGVQGVGRPCVQGRFDFLGFETLKRNADLVFAWCKTRE